MKQYVVNIKRYGDYDSPYTVHTLIGTVKPQELFDSFESKNVKNKDVYGFLTTLINKEEGEDFGAYLKKMDEGQKMIAKELLEHFKKNGYKEYKTYDINIGD